MNATKILLVVLLCFIAPVYGLSVSPTLVGNGATDSVTIVVPINDIDTVQVYTAMDLTASDKISYWYYGPDGVLVDSDTNSANITKQLDGNYKIRLKSSNGSSALGDYYVIIQVYFKGKWRAAGSVSYTVIDEGIGTYFEYLLNHAYYDGGCDNCTQTWYTKTVGGKVVTDSIIVTESGVRKQKITYNRAPGSTVITSVLTEKL